MTQSQKSLIMPVAMVTGITFHSTLVKLNPLTPYLIFLMLFITFCRISLKDMKLSMMHFWLISFQIVMSLATYFGLRGFDEIVAQGTMICILAPTATAAVVVAAMLGAGVANMATYSLLCNMVIAIAAPLIFSMVGASEDISFWSSALTIGSRIIPLLIMPFVAAMALQRVWNRAYLFIQGQQPVSFYLWVVALTIMSGRMTYFILEQDPSNRHIGIIIALIAFVVCAAQFLIGRFIGRRYGDVVAGGQSLGQKNTILAIWMSQTYLNPISSLGPAAYILWQNLANSYQLWRYREK